jgi:tetratricopeptide (TPR) repeat protein
MVTKVLEIVDLPDSGQVQLAWASNSERQTAPPVPLQSLLDDAARNEIGWYFQSFLQDPFGPSKTRGETVEGGLRNLGRLLFEVVFRGNPEANAGFSQARSDGLAEYQLSIISQRAEFLDLPWELMNEAEVGYVAPLLASVVRQTSGTPLDFISVELSNQQFNVLQVSPMPGLEDQSPAGGARDATPLNPGNMSREALRVLESLEVEVELERARPGTLEALTGHLSGRRGHFHLVHLDGINCDDSGALLFEDESGAAVTVAPSTLAELFAQAGVPIVLVNAGGANSQLKPGQWASIAAQLAESGVPQVVLVPHALPPAGRELFVGRLVRQLVQGKDAAQAVATARQTLMDQPQRTSTAGPIIYWDWIVPTVFQSAQCALPTIEAEQADPLTPPNLQPQDTHEDAIPQGGPYGLLGREAEMRQLERLLQRNPVVLMTGSTGVGKSELALGLARWSQNTGARPGGVFYSSFEVGAGLERVVHEIGTTVVGLPFADMTKPNQREWIVEYLSERSCLLVWDGVESVAGFPEQEANALLDASERTELASFVSEITQTGSTSVLLASRKSAESWLTTPSANFALTGLSPYDRLEFAWELQDKLGLHEAVTRERAEIHLGQDYLRLLELIEGHPLAIRIAIPVLKEVPASVMLTELNARMGQLTAASLEDGRDPFLTALMDYSFSRMSHRSRVHLPFFSLFQRRVMMDILTHITQERAYRTAMGEELGWGACRTLLRSAREAGFLDPVTPSVYQIHPALPWFYGRKLSGQAGGNAIRQLEQEFVRVYADTADYFMETLYENQDAGATAVLAEEGNITQALGLALEDSQWDSVQVLVQPLAQVYRMQKRYPELRRLRRQLLEAIAPDGRGSGEADSKGAIELWMYLLGTEASEATETLDFAHADGLNRQLLEYLSSTDEGAADPRTASVYHQMGVAEQHRWNLDGAEDLFQSSLAIIEGGEEQEAIADDYFSIGQIRQYQRRYTEAKEWYQKALDIHQRIGDGEEMVKDYRALGLAAQYKFEYEEAESWYQQARAILEENRDEENVVLVFHELGTVYHARYLFEEAESWYQQALHLSDRLGMHTQMATEFHHLGLLCQARGMFYEDAEEWFELALDKREGLGDRRGAGDECRHLGLLLHEHNQYDKAEQWYRKALEAFEEVGDLNRTARTYGQLGKLAEDGGDLPGALEWAARTYQLAVDHSLPVLVQVKAHLGGLRDKYGEAEFTTWWHGFMGSEPPPDLDVNDLPPL